MDRGVKNLAAFPLETHLISSHDILSVPLSNLIQITLFISFKFSVVKGKCERSYSLYSLQNDYLFKDCFHQ